MRSILPFLLACALLSSQMAWAAPSVASSGGYTGAGWQLLRFQHVTNTTVTMTFHGGSCPYMGAMVFLDEAGVWQASFTGICWGGEGHATIDVVGVHRSTRFSGSGAPGQATLIMDVSGQPFDGYLLFWSAGGLRATSWAVTSEGDASATIIATGSGGHHSDGRDFVARRQVTVMDDGTGVTIQQNASRPLPIAHTFVGIIGDGRTAVGDESLVLAAEDGTRHACPCWSYDLGGPGALRPGDAMLWRNTTNVEILGGSLLAGVDVPWPPPGQ